MWPWLNEQIRSHQLHAFFMQLFLEVLHV